MRMTTTNHPKVHMGPTTDCPKCGGPRTWRQHTRQWSRHCQECARNKQTRVRRARGQAPKQHVPADRKPGDPSGPCKKCGTETRWTQKPSTGDWQRQCGPCSRAADLDYRARNPEKCSQARRAYYQENKEVFYAHNAKRRAKLAEVPDDGWSFAALTQMKNTGEYTCFICEKATATEVEHLVPVSLGGGNTWDNLALACKSCNGSKGGSNRHDHLYPGSPGWDEFLRERRES